MGLDLSVLLTAFDSFIKEFLNYLKFKIVELNIKRNKQNLLKISQKNFKQLIPTMGYF